MANEHVNKVVFGGNTLIDLTTDTVTPETLSRGVTAHNAAGRQIVGTMNSGSETLIVPVTLPASILEGNAVTVTMPSGTAAQIATALTAQKQVFIKGAVHSVEQGSDADVTIDVTAYLPVHILTNIDIEVGGESVGSPIVLDGASFMDGQKVVFSYNETNGDNNGTDETFHFVLVKDTDDQAFMTCSISDSDISSTSDGRVVYTTQLETGTYSQAYSAIESGTPMILQIAMQSEDETTQELSTESYICVPIAYAGIEDDIGGACTLDEGVNLVVNITSAGVVTITMYFGGDSEYYVDISCTAQELLSGSFNSNLGSGTFAEALDAANIGHKDVCVRIHVNNDFIIGNVLLSVFNPPQETSESSFPGYAFGSTTVRTSRTSFDGTEKLFNIAVKLASDDTAIITTVVVAEREIIPINISVSDFTQMLMTWGSVNTTLTSGTISKVNNLLDSGTLVYAQIKVINESQEYFNILLPLIMSEADSSTQISGTITSDTGIMRGLMHIDNGTEIFELQTIQTSPAIVSANYTRVADDETIAGLSITGAEFNAAYNTYLYKSSGLFSSYSIAYLTSRISSGKSVKFSIRGLKYPNGSLVVNLPDAMIDQVQADNNEVIWFSGLYYNILTPVMVQGMMFEYNNSIIIYCFAKKADYLMSTSASGVSF